MTVADRRVLPSLLQVDSIVGHLSGRQALSEICRFLRAEFPHYGWVGIYRRDGAELLLEAWEGLQPTEHARIGLDQGLCGAAVRENRTRRVGDVSSAPEYLACFPDTRSEIVVPIREGGQAIGEIDIDGTALNAYDASDERFLLEVAGRLAGPLHQAAGEPRPG